MQVLDPDVGWAGFREHYSSNTWQWLTAATNARCENALLCFWLIFTQISIRFLLLSASMSESSLVKISGINFCLLTPPYFPYSNTQLVQNDFHDSGTLGIDRQNIKTFFKDPSRRNVFLQVRSVEKISIRFKGIWKTSRTALTLDWLISETLIARVASSTSLPCRAEKSKCSAGPQSLSGE